MVDVARPGITPGDWSAAYYDDDSFLGVLAVREGRVPRSVIVAAGEGDSVCIDDADLALILAAPALLAACRKAIDVFGGVMIDDNNRDDPATLAGFDAVLELTAAVARATQEESRL